MIIEPVVEMGLRPINVVGQAYKRGELFEHTREGFLAAYRYELMRSQTWRGGYDRIDVLISRAQDTLNSTLRLWNCATPEVERAYRLIGGIRERVTLEALRELPPGDAMKTFEIVLNSNAVKADGGFTDWLRKGGNQVEEVFRFGRPSLVNGKPVTIGRRNKRERSYEERVIDMLYRLYRLSTLTPSEEGLN